METIVIILVPLFHAGLLFCIFYACFKWDRVYLYLFFPHREPDFEHRLYVYWFDEKVAYSKLATRKKKKFYDIKGVLYEDYGSNQKYVELFDNKAGLLPLEVQQAYKEHTWKKFEEIVLES